jgi:archaellum biogenesis protein FlaJ (TadC family)
MFPEQWEEDFFALFFQTNLFSTNNSCQALINRFINTIIMKRTNGNKKTNRIRNAILLGIVCLSLTAAAQETVPDSILYFFRGIVTLKDGTTLKNAQLVEMMKNCPEALTPMKKAKSRSKAQTILVTTGTIVLIPAIIYGTVIQLSPTRPSNASYIAFFVMSGVGLSLDIAGLIAGAGHKKLKSKAVEAYNNCLKNRQATTQLKLGATTHGVGLTLNF